MMLQVKHASRPYSSVVIHTPDTDVSMIALSKIIEFDCHLYLKTATKSCKRTIDISAVAQCVNHNINKTDWDKDTFLKALIFRYFTGCDSTSSFAGKSKLKPLSWLSSNENYIYGFSQVRTSCTVAEDIYQLMKLDITSTVSGTGEYYLRCYTMLKCFKAAYRSSKLSNINLEKVFR